MPLISITKTFKSRCKPPVTPPGGGGEPPQATHPIYFPIVPTHPIVIPPPQPEPPRPDNSLPLFPSNPIYLPIGGTPDTPNVPSNPIYLPVYPSHPIVFPPEIDNSLPGGEKPVVTPPIYIPPEEINPYPPTAEHPIYWPIVPDNTLPVPPGGTQPPLVIWGPNDPRPSPPIFIPIQPPEGVHPEQPIYIPVYPDNSLPGDQPYPDIGLPGDQPYPDQGLPPIPPGSGLTPENPIVLPPGTVPPGTSTIYVSLTPGVPIEVSVSGGKRR